MVFMPPMGELESIGSESGESEGRSAMRWTASEWAPTGMFTPAAIRAHTATGTGRINFVGLMYSYIVLINGLLEKKA
jgi:hypothetical protein